MSEAIDDGFVKTHERLVQSLAARVRGQLELKTEVEDLVAYGMQGLLEARARFDPERGVRFEYFAYYRVRGAIMDGVRRMAYLPRRTHIVRKAAEALDRAAEEAALARAESPSERASVAKTLETIDDILGRTSAAFVIAAVGQSEEHDAPESPESQTLHRELADRVRGALDVLDERERKLVEGHYLEDRTLEEIGAELGIGKSWASRLASRALRKMRIALSPDEALATAGEHPPER